MNAEEFKKRVEAVRALKTEDKKIDEDNIKQCDTSSNIQDYANKCIDRIIELTEPPYTIKSNGTKEYAKNYFNIDYHCLLWFCESVSFNPKVCDLLLFTENATVFRTQVVDSGLPLIAHWRFGK